MKRGFTLLEVNLAIFIMATGTLVMCGLYSLGFRESRQSTEDVAATAYADAFLGPLLQGLSATNMTWTQWQQIGDSPKNDYNGAIYVDGIWPKNGWREYVQEPRERGSTSYRMNGDPKSRANSVFSQVLSKCPSLYRGSNPGIDSDYNYGLVVTRHGAVVQLAFRLGRRKETLMSQPLIVSEVHFQGDPDK